MSAVDDVYRSHSLSSMDIPFTIVERASGGAWMLLRTACTAFGFNACSDNPYPLFGIAFTAVAETKVDVPPPATSAPEPAGGNTLSAKSKSKPPKPKPKFRVSGTLCLHGRETCRLLFWHTSLSSMVPYPAHAGARFRKVHVVLKYTHEAWSKRVKFVHDCKRVQRSILFDGGRGDRGAW